MAKIGVVGGSGMGNRVLQPNSLDEMNAISLKGCDRIPFSLLGDSLNSCSAMLDEETVKIV
jgi:hypothetical protein